MKGSIRVFRMIEFEKDPKNSKKNLHFCYRLVCMQEYDASRLHRFEEIIIIHSKIDHFNAYVVSEYKSIEHNV